MKKIVLTSVVALAAVSTAYAGGPSSMGAPAADAGHWYVGAGVNYGATTSYDDGAGQTYDGNDTSWSAFAGRQVNDWFAVETGYTSIGDADFEGANPVKDTWSFDLQGVFSHNIMTTGMMQLSGLLTTGVSYLSTESSEGGVSPSWDGFVWTYGAGIAMQFDQLQNFTLRADWRHYSVEDSWSPLVYAPDMISLKLVYGFS